MLVTDFWSPTSVTNIDKAVMKIAKETNLANPKCLNMGGLIETCEIDELEAFIEGGFSDVSIEDISQDIRQTSTGNIIFI